MAQREKVLAAKLENLRSIQETHTGKREMTPTVILGLPPLHHDMSPPKKQTNK